MGDRPDPPADGAGSPADELGPAADAPLRRPVQQPGSDAEDDVRPGHQQRDRYQPL
ncbi:hypothetical protein [Kribbella sp. DT2]|uniref:hypothetical protein n=1 Tax=Kribbella sp. DT2 TaxID=3393427 RepID=UPI003CEF0939